MLIKFSTFYVLCTFVPHFLVSFPSNFLSYILGVWCLVTGAISYNCVVGREQIIAWTQPDSSNLTLFHKLPSYQGLSSLPSGLVEVRTISLDAFKKWLMKLQLYSHSAEPASLAVLLDIGRGIVPFLLYGFRNVCENIGYPLLNYIVVFHKCNK